MANKKITQLTQLDETANNGVPASGDKFLLVDISDTTGASTGTTKFVEYEEIIKDIVVSSLASSAVVIESEGISSNDNDTTLPTSAAVKDYVDTNVTAQDLDFQGDSGGALAIDLDSETLTLAGGTGIDTVGSSNTVTASIDSTVATLTGSQTLTNKTLTSPVIDTGVSGTAIKDEDTMSSDSATHICTQQSIKAYVDSASGAGEANQNAWSTITVPAGTTSQAADTATDSVAFTAAGGMTITGGADDTIEFSSADTSDLVTFTPSGTGATNRTVEAKLRDTVSAKDFGATGDGSTDDATAVQAAIDAMEAAGGGTVHFPSGTYMIGTRLVIDTTNVAIVGEGRWQSILKASGTLTSLLHIGVTDATSTEMQAEVSNIQLHGNSTCTDAVLKLWCPVRCVVNHVHIRSGANYGLKSDTHTGTVNTQAWANHYLDIKAESNGGSGFYFVGEKDTQFDNLHAYNNGGDGFFWGGAYLNPSGTSQFETTTCTIGTCLSRDNTGSGFVMDGVEKFSIGQLESTINSGYGLKFLTSNTTANSIALNSLQCASFISRNDSAGGLRMADNSQVMSTHFGSVIVRGPTMTAGAIGIYLAGTDAITIGSIYVVSVPGTALQVDSGTPLGGSSTPCTNMKFGNVYLNSNGATGQTSHGLYVGNASQVTIGTLTTKNSFTDTGTSNYEINAYNSADIRFSGGVEIDATHADNAINGNNINFGGALSLQNADPYIALRDNSITNPTVLANYAALYVDSADGDLKIKFGDSTVKTIAPGKVELGMACSDETTALTTGNAAAGTAKLTFRMPHAMTLTEVRASVTTAPVGSTIIVDINDGGTTIMSSTKLSIDASEKTSTTAAAAAVLSDTALADDAEITVDVDQIGSSTAGAGLKIWLIGYR